MLRWTAFLAVVACIATLGGASGVAAGAAGLARISFFLFLVGFTASLLVRRMRRRHLATSLHQRQLRI